jgi:hypothetical protein
MKKIFLILVFTLLILNKSYAATGAATQYEITMKKVELCTDATCTAPIIVGERDMAADIAAANAGATVGNYASTSGISSGTYTHLRVTLSRTFTITGTVEFGGGTCATDGGTDHTATQLLDAGTGTATSTSMYLSNADTYGSDDGIGEDAGTGITLNYDSPTYATSMTMSGDNVLIVYELTTPYTRLLKTPLIKVAFATTAALGAATVGDCIMWVEEPSVTITIQ